MVKKVRVCKFILSAGIAGVLLATSALQEAQAAPSPIVTDSRIRTYVYNENEVFKLITDYGYQSNIEFGEEEQIHTISMGDVSGFKVQPAGNRIFIRALQSDKHTNMTVITTERVYQFELSSAVESDADIIYVMRFYYPEEDFDPVTGQPITDGRFVAPNVPTMTMNAGGPAMPQGRPAQLMPQPQMGGFTPPPPPLPQTQPGQQTRPEFSPPPRPPSELGAGRGLVPPAPPSTSAISAPPPEAMLGDIEPEAGSDQAALRVNYDYTLEGPEALSPWQVYDDGNKTYIKFAEGVKLPETLQVVDQEEEQREVIPAFENDYIVLPGVFKQIIVTDEDKQLIIYNEAKLRVS